MVYRKRFLLDHRNDDNDDDGKAMNDKSLIIFIFFFLIWCSSSPFDTNNLKIWCRFKCRSFSATRKSKIQLIWLSACVFRHFINVCIALVDIFTKCAHDCRHVFFFSFWSKFTFKVKISLTSLNHNCWLRKISIIFETNWIKKEKAV